MASLLEFLCVFILGVFVGATATTFRCKQACRQALVDDEALVDTMAAPEGLVDDVEPLQKKQRVPSLLEPRAAAASSANRIQLPENEVMEIPKWLRRQLSWSDSSDEGSSTTTSPLVTIALASLA